MWHKTATKGITPLSTKQSALQTVLSLMDLVLWRDEGTTGHFFCEVNWTSSLVLSWLYKGSNTACPRIVDTARESTFKYLSPQGDNLPDEQRVYNTALSSARVTLKYIFKEMKFYWTTVEFKRKMRVNQSPVDSMYTAVILITDFRNYPY